MQCSEKSEGTKSQALKNSLLAIFYTDTIGSCHVENAVELLLELPEEKIAHVLRLVRLIAHSVSDLLAFSFMENVENALELLNLDQLEAWVTHGLSIYESKGLLTAKEFFANPDETTLPFRGLSRVATLEEASNSLNMLACGLSGRNVVFKPSSIPWTDTETIWLPESFSLFEKMDDNMLFFRVAAAHKCAQIRYGSFVYPANRLKELLPDFDKAGGSERPGVILFLEEMKGRYPGLDVGRLFSLVDTIRIEQRLARQYRGLARDIHGFKNLLWQRLNSSQRLHSKGLSKLVRYILSDYVEKPDFQSSAIIALMEKLRKDDSTSGDSMALLIALIELNEVEAGLLKEINTFLPYVGSIDTGEVEAKLRERRKLLEETFVQILGTLLSKVSSSESRLQEDEMEDKRPKGAILDPRQIQEALAIIVENGQKDRQRTFEDKEGLLTHIQMEAEGNVLEQLFEITKEIVNDFGQIPSLYVSSAMDLATGLYDHTIAIKDSSDAAPLFSFYTYPEWDFRRSDYRQDWCTVKEMASKGSSGSFVGDVLKRYKGQVSSLRRQFEMIRQDYNVIKRQRDGQEIDVDAFVEAYTDVMAELSPSEHLYHRLVRNRRDIAVLFLVDMSASTEGWINRAIKESLVLMATAMECVGDQYAIYGFSGMRRTGCQYFVIKEFQDEFSNKVKERITGIRPKDYTRMGPAIRHSVQKLSDVEARIKILLTLSDGKPEDYDEYKGPYAIEDTRMALFEAKRQGIKPFCITIDKEARQYLPRLYGAANYVLVPDVRLLHKRVPEIYKILTS